MTIFDDNFPYTDFEQLNLDWIIDVVKTIQDEWENFDPDVYATATEGPVNVTVSGDLLTGITFDFTLPKGDKGDTGDTGNGIASAILNPDYTLTLVYTNGTSYTTPSIRGATGPQGPAGVGVITGGSTGQALVKASNTDYDTQWVSVQEPLTAGTGINITSNIIKTQFDQLTSPDLDTVNYNYQGYVTSSTNMPSGVSGYGELIVASRGASGNCIQLYSPADVNRLFIRKYYNNAWTTWREFSDCYMAGDTLNFSKYVYCTGYITNSAKTIIFQLPLTKYISASNVSFSAMYVDIRGIEGTIISNTDVIADSTITVTTGINNSGIVVSLDKTTAFSTVTNNTPITVTLRGANTVLTFS